MKYLIILFLSVSLACAHEIRLRNGIKPKKFPPIKIDEHILRTSEWEKLKSHLEKEQQKNLGAGVEADVTEFALAILKNVASLLVHAGYDPMELSDTHLSLFPGTLDLTNGWLQDLSSITVSDPVIARYSLTTHVWDLTLPLAFDTLLIDFDYHVQIILVGISGTIDAKLSDLKIDLHLGFNFTEYHAFVDNIDVKNSGNITIDFTGLGLLDWIIEIMASALTTLFHTLIFSIVDAIIYDPVQGVVQAINDAIDTILNPNATSFMMNLNL